MEVFNRLLVEWTAGDFFKMLFAVVTLGTLLGNLICDSLEIFFRGLLSIPGAFREGLQEGKTTEEKENDDQEYLSKFYNNEY